MKLIFPRDKRNHKKLHFGDIFLCQSTMSKDVYRLTMPDVAHGNYCWELVYANDVTTHHIPDTYGTKEEALNALTKLYDSVKKIKANLVIKQVGPELGKIGG